MVPENLINDVFHYVEVNRGLGRGCSTDVDGLLAFSNTTKTECSAAIYDPIMCLVLQGAKEAYIGGRVLRYGAGDTLIVSHAVPLESAVIQATPKQPFVALALRLDLALARSLYDEIDGIGETESDTYALNVAASDAALSDAVARLFRISQDPTEARALAPLVLKEIHFRLLRAQHGGMLRQLLRHDSPANRISKSIAIIRMNFRNTLSVANLATESGMSLSAFHEHFKSVTATTPLQYQKELRLFEAQRLLLSGNATVASAAFDVGYESPTQFSREFSRKFGLSPNDLKSASALYAV
jgi:AraC-like DNA-binding protein